MNTKLLSAAFAAGCFAFVLVSPLFGQNLTNYIWTGASNNLWSEASNWNPAGPPGVADTYVTFDNAGNGHTTIDLSTSPTNMGMLFNPGAGAYTIGTAGQSLRLAANYDYPWITVSAGVTNNQTIAANIEVFQGRYVPAQVVFSNNSSSALTFSGTTIAGAGGEPGDRSVLYLGGNGTGVSTINSYINFPLSGPNVGITKSGSGTWQLLNPTNTLFGGLIWIREGTLVVSSLNNMDQPSSIGVMSGGANTNFWIGLNGDATLRYVGTSSTTDWDWSIGAIDAPPAGTNRATTATFDIMDGATLVMNGSQKNDRASAAGILVKAGTGTLALNGTNEYTGATILNEGVLSVMVINNAGQASGIGAASAAATNLVFNGGTLKYFNGNVGGYTDRNFTITDGNMASFDVSWLLQMVGSTGPTTGGVSLTGGGTLVLGGENFYLGPTIVDGGSLVAASSSKPFGGGPFGIGSDVNLNASGNLALYNGYQSVSYNASIGSLAGQLGSWVTLGSGTLTIDGTNSATFGGSLLGTNGGLVMSGSGTQTLTGTNGYTGATVVQGGTLAVSGTNGAINTSGSIAISGGGTLAVENFGAATATNRIGDATAIILGGGTLSFRSNTNTPDFSETLGALALTAGYNTIENGQAASGKTSTLTFASLTRTGSATVNFSGAGLGQSDRNRILFASAPTLGDWATYNGVGYAVYDTTNGIVESLYTDVTRGSSGQKLIYTATNANVRVVDGTGTPGPIALGTGGITAIHALVQSATNGPVTLDISNEQTFQTMSVLVGSNAGGLTIGAAPNVGHLSSSYAALTGELRPLRLINNSTNLLVINSSITNEWLDGGGMAIALEKLGPGTVVLAGSNSYDGVTTIGQGVLSVSDVSFGGNLGTATGYAGNLVFDGGTLLYTGANTVTDRGFTVNASGSRLETSADLLIVTNIGPYPPVGSNGVILAAGDLTVAGAGYTTIWKEVSGAGALRKEGASTLTLGGTNTFTGGVTIREGAVSVTSIGFGGQAGNLGAAGNASTNLVLDGGTLYFNGPGAGTDRGMSVTARGGTLVNANAGENLVFTTGAGNDISIAHGGTFTVDGPGEVTLENEISGHGALRKTGDGVLRLLEPVNTFTGGVTLSGGITQAGSNIGNGGEAGSLGAASPDPSNIVFDGGTLELTSYSPSSQSTDRGFTISAGKTATLNLDGNVGLAMSGSVPNTSGGLAKTGTGTLTLSGNLAYNGATTVSQGRLNIDGTLTNGTAVTVATNATLGGSGTIHREVDVHGTHSPGSSAGVQTIEQHGLYYYAGANVVWELFSSTTDGRGTNYDGIDGGGYNELQFAGATKLDLVFNAPGSTVKWSDQLWGTNRQWVVYSGFIPSYVANFSLDLTNWADIDGALFDTLLPDSTFSLAQSGQDIVLNYQGVPEPSTWALLIAAVLLAALRLRRQVIAWRD